MGGGGRYPYPKNVWTPSGGWWTNPSNWMMNTAICTVGALAVTYVTWNYSADREQRHNPPRKPIPSMLWARQFKSGEMKIEPDP